MAIPHLYHPGLLGPVIAKFIWRPNTRGSQINLAVTGYLATTTLAPALGLPWSSSTMLYKPGGQPPTSNVCR